MVHDTVWAAAGANKGFLCVGCLERRLGRPLNEGDFPPVLINLPYSWDTRRLALAKMTPALTTDHHGH